MSGPSSESLHCVRRNTFTYLLLLMVASVGVVVSQFKLMIPALALPGGNDRNNNKAIVPRHSALQRNLDSFHKSGGLSDIKSIKAGILDERKTKEKNDQRLRVDKDIITVQGQSDRIAPARSANDDETNQGADGDYRKCTFNQPFPRLKQGCITSQETGIPYCQINQLRLDVDNIAMGKGGEPLDTVMGQEEAIEFPVYTAGSFMTTKKMNMTSARNKKQFFYVKDVTKNLKVTDPLPSCSQRITGHTLMITRYEYCNAFHTVTDWFNAFLALPSPLTHDKQNTTIVFLDAHPQGKLDPVWGTLWGNVIYAKQLPSGGVCFDDVTLIPAGYSSVLWSRGRKLHEIQPCPNMMKAFVKFFVDGHEGLRDVKMKVGKVTIIDRIPYLAHPRSKPKNAERMVQNFDDIAKALQKSIPAVTSVEIVRFETMTFAEQLKTIRETHILIGNHGAGMSHMLFLQDGAACLEFQQQASSMFVEFARWKPMVQHMLLPSIVGNMIHEELIHNSVVPLVKNILVGGDETSNPNLLA